jgi:hypothetical protein
VLRDRHDAGAVCPSARVRGALIRARAHTCGRCLTPLQLSNSSGAARCRMRQIAAPRASQTQPASLALRGAATGAQAPGSRDAVWPCQSQRASPDGQNDGPYLPPALLNFRPLRGSQGLQRRRFRVYPRSSRRRQPGRPSSCQPLTRPGAFYRLGSEPARQQPSEGAGDARAAASGAVRSPGLAMAPVVFRNGNEGASLYQFAGCHSAPPLSVLSCRPQRLIGHCGVAPNRSRVDAN